MIYMVFFIKVHFHRSDLCEAENNCKPNQSKTWDFIEACRALALYPATSQLCHLEQVGFRYLCRVSGSWAVKGESFFRIYGNVKTSRPISGVVWVLNKG